MNKVCCKGFTLIEIMVAIAIFAIVITTATSSINSYQKLNHGGEIRSEASQAAQSIIDQIRGIDVKSLPTSGDGTPVEITMNSNRMYSVETIYCTNSSICNSPSVRQIAVEVYHRDALAYTTEVIFTDFGAAPGSNYSATPTPVFTPTPAPSTSVTPTATTSYTPTPTPTPKKKKKCKTWKC